MLHADIDASWADFSNAIKRLTRPSKSTHPVPRVQNGCRAAHKVASVIVTEAEPRLPRASMTSPQPAASQSPPPSVGGRVSSRPNSQWLRVLDPDQNASNDTLTGQNGQRSISFSHTVVATAPLSTPRTDRAHTVPPPMQMPRPIPESYDFSHLDRDPPAPLPTRMPMPEPARSNTVFCDSPQPMSTYSRSGAYSRGNTLMAHEATQDSGLDGILREIGIYNQQHMSGLPTVDDSPTATNSPDGTLDGSSFVNYVLGPAAGEREPTFPIPFPSDRGLVRV